MIPILVAFLLCVPDIHMTKADFLECVEPVPDEYKVAKEYDIPQRIDPHTQTTEDQSRWQWVYTDKRGDVSTFFFASDGH